VQKTRFPHRFCNGVPLRPHLYSADSLKTACAVEQDRSLMQCASSNTIRYHSTPCNTPPRARSAACSASSRCAAWLAKASAAVLSLSLSLSPALASLPKPAPPPTRFSLSLPLSSPEKSESSARNRSLFEVFLCLSRACLGKKMHFYTQMTLNAVCLPESSAAARFFLPPLPAVALPAPFFFFFPLLCCCCC
jgi:hypothetical protein